MHLTSDKRIWIPDDDDWFKWGESYEKIEFHDVMNHISKWDVALDIGAHVGIWSMRLAKKFKRVIAFEPVPKHIECWKQNMLKFTDEKSEWGNIFILNEIALSDVSGTDMIKIPNVTNSGMASLDFTQRQGRWLQPEWDDFPEVEVEVKTLDSFEFDQIDFIKIDVEWLELKVLQGAVNTIKKHKPIIYIEINDIEVFHFMENSDLGYRIVYANGLNRLYKAVENRTYSQSISQMLNYSKYREKIEKNII